jgi:hypothetical protein
LSFFFVCFSSGVMLFILFSFSLLKQLDLGKSCLSIFLSLNPVVDYSLLFKIIPGYFADNPRLFYQRFD